VVIGTDYGHTDASSEVDAIDIFRANKQVADSKKQNPGTTTAPNLKRAWS
jgi:hypothetical protein